MQKWLIFFLIFFSLLVCGVLGWAFWHMSVVPQASDEEKIKVLVTIPPQKYLVEKIGGSHVKVVALIPPGASHETYEPTPKDIQALSQADVYMGIGNIGFEVVQLPRIQEMYPALTFIDTSEGVSFRTLEHHSHEDEEEIHEEGDERDPHIWLSPKNLKIQAQHITQALTAFMPEKAEEFSKNQQALFDELDRVDGKLRETLLPLEGKTVLVYHPAFGYLFDEYGLIQEHIEIEGREPALAEVESLIQEAKRDGIRVIFVQEQFSQAVARTIAEELGGVVVSLDPLKEDVVQNLQDLAHTLKENL